VRTDLEIYSLKRPIQKIATGETLRILDEKNFDVVWSVDGWKTTQTTMSRSLGSAGHSADIATGPAGGKLEWTVYWNEQKAWLGYNVVVQVEQK